MNSTKCTEKVVPTAHNLLQGTEAEGSFLTHPGGRHDPDTLPWKERELQTKIPYELWRKKARPNTGKRDPATREEIHAPQPRGFVLGVQSCFGIKIN